MNICCFQKTNTVVFLFRKHTTFQAPRKTSAATLTTPPLCFFPSTEDVFEVHESTSMSNTDNNNCESPKNQNDYIINDYQNMTSV